MRRQHCSKVGLGNQVDPYTEQIDCKSYFRLFFHPPDEDNQVQVRTFQSNHRLIP